MACTVLVHGADAGVTGAPVAAALGGANPPRE
jgi:hypothetical protein